MSWVQTFTGKQFWPLNPKAEDVCIEDIAHALSMKCRYGGHTLSFYSVAEHSVLVSRALPEHLRLVGLLHDAAEAYSPFGDVPRPLKRELPWVEAIETKLDVAITERFGLPYPWPDEVKEVDRRILADERKVLLPGGPPWEALGEPLGVTLPIWHPWYAEKVFLSEFRRLTFVGVSG